MPFNAGLLFLAKLQVLSYGKMMDTHSVDASRVLQVLPLDLLTGDGLLRTRSTRKC